MNRQRLWSVILLVILISSIAACTSSPTDDQPLPTLFDPTRHPTYQFLTEQAPPPGFGELNTLSAVDNTLRQQNGWTYTVTATFDGIYDVSGDPVTGSITLQVQGNEPSRRRRVLLSAEGGAFLPDEGVLELEGVRFSNDYYMVDVTGACTSDQGGQMVGAAVADLGASNLIGGVTFAIPSGQKQEIGGLQAWQYTFALENMTLPAIHRRTDSRVEVQADLWFAPAVNATLLYEVTANVARVHLLWADQTESTVSGTLYLRYELDIPALGELPNISVPNGC